MPTTPPARTGCRRRWSSRHSMSHWRTIMCEGCFWGEWHDREDGLTLDRYLAELPAETREQIDHLYRLLDENSAGRFCTIDGLHAGVNNDNYDSPSYRAGSRIWNEAGDPAVVEACDLWDSMSEEARSIAVALWDPYPQLHDAFVRAGLLDEPLQFAEPYDPGEP